MTYPLSLPSALKFTSVDFGSVNAVVYNASPFTFAGQAQAFGGQRWEASVTLPPMRDGEARAWVAFFTRLRGQFGTFLMGHPFGCTPRGSAGGTPLVAAGNVAGSTLNVTGATASQTGWLLAGDYIQIGSGSGATLHQVMQDADSDGSGNVALDIWPYTRTAPTASGAVVTSSPVGNWRLSGDVRHSVNSAATYGISFSAIEAIT